MQSSLAPLLQDKNDLLRRISRRIAEMSRQDMQRGGDSANNEPEIQDLSKIETILKDPETYNPLDYPLHTMIDKLHKYEVIDGTKKTALLSDVRGKRPDHPSLIPST